MRFVMQIWPMAADRKTKKLFLLYLIRFNGGGNGTPVEPSFVDAARFARIF